MKKVQESEYDKISKLYKDGMSQQKIADLYHIGRTTVRRILLKTNTPIRDNSHKGRIYSLNENYFDSIDTPNKAYILGLLYADGCSSKNFNTVRLMLQERDKSILEKILVELESSHPLHFHPLHEKNSNWQNAYSISITNKHISQSLASHGVVPNKSFVLTFPEWLDESLYRDFIRGYFDGDGHIGWGKNRSCSLCSTQEFCEAVQKICESFGIKSGISDTANKETNTKVLYICGKEKIFSFLKFMYEDAELYIERKYNTYKLVCKEMENK